MFDSKVTTVQFGKSLTILNVAYPFGTVGPDSIGGAEQVVAQLDFKLSQFGHASIVIASAGSRVTGRLLPTPHWDGSLNEKLRQKAAAAHADAIARVLQCHPIDVIHLHGFDFHQYWHVCSVPTLVTLHLPINWYPPHIFTSKPLGTSFNCVSASQRHSCPSSVELLPEIENGVSLDLFNAHCSKRNFAIALGRICPEKGFHIALDAARHAHMPLLLGGKVYAYPEHEEYFRRQVVPRLDASRRFLGPLTGRRKARLLSAAKCLLAPSLAPETSSLAAMEALASGTPVVAFGSGALADIVDHGKTGFLVKDETQMSDAIHECANLLPEDCRKAARTRFNFDQTIQKYMQVYGELAERGSAQFQYGLDRFRRSTRSVRCR